MPPKPPYQLNYAFYTPENYQQVYRVILNNAQACTKQGVISRSVAEGQYFTDIKSADVTISTHAPFGKYPHIRVSIETENNQTRVVVTNDFESWDGLARVIKDWVTRNSRACKQKAR